MTVLKPSSNHEDSEGPEDAESAMTSVLVTAVSPVTSISAASQNMQEESDNRATQKPSDAEMVSMSTRPSSTTLRGSACQDDAASVTPILQKHIEQAPTVPNEVHLVGDPG